MSMQPNPFRCGARNGGSSKSSLYVKPTYMSKADHIGRKTVVENIVKEESYLR